MRYEDWDVLLFPRGSKVPMKEFKTNCHVVQDAEFAYTNGSYGLPTMTCFMPGLRPGTPFNISLHCWQTPEMSQFTKNSFGDHLDLVRFEARVLIDGRLVASSSFSRSGPWPQLLNHSFDFTKDGELESLKFPQFRSELLRQSYWSPADEIGRIKIVISEGFPRDSLSVPIERVKNVIAFSFQHAPIDILESSGIAWPNPTMWRRGPFNPSMPVPTQHPKEGAEAHLHSPRRQSSYNRTAASSSGHSSGIPGLSAINSNPNTLLSSMPNTQALLQRAWCNPASGFNDPFNQQNSDPMTFVDWSNTTGSVGHSQNTADTAKSSYNPASTRKNAARRITNSDISMPDFGLNSASNPHIMAENFNFSNSGLEEPGASTYGPKVPTNTPTTMSFLDELGVDVNKIGTPGNTPPTSEFFNTNTHISPELAASLTHSLLNQPHPLPVHAANVPLPASEIKSRKENRGHFPDSLENTPTVEHVDLRKVSQTSFNNLGKDSKDNSSNNSPPSSRTFSGVFSTRSTSVGEFGHDLTNLSNFTNSNTDSISTGIPNTDVCASNSGPAKDAKRPRHFTPASSKVIDDEDEPRRGSPRMRLFEESN